jgi:hypothetical protein
MSAARGNGRVNLSDFPDRAAPNPCKMGRIPTDGIRLGHPIRSPP